MADQSYAGKALLVTGGGVCAADARVAVSDLNVAHGKETVGLTGHQLAVDGGLTAI